jgi:uncharacterized protein YuzE
MEDKKSMNPQVTYDEEAQAGYLYLSSKLALQQEKVSRTKELVDNILLDFNQENKLIGVEFLFEVAEALKPWGGFSHVFVKKYLQDGRLYFSFQIDQCNIKKMIYLKESDIVFLFSDEKGKDFLGINIYDINMYSQEYLLGF